ncbi:hypothetical protein AB4Z51_28225 [Bradyrhizobium sp. 2TAF36]
MSADLPCEENACGTQSVDGGMSHAQIWTEFTPPAHANLNIVLLAFFRTGNHTEPDILAIIIF